MKRLLILSKMQANREDGKNMVQTQEDTGRDNFSSRSDNVEVKMNG